MRAFSSGKLYTPELLALATDLARYPLTDDLTHRGQARSRTCGSTMDIGFSVDGDGLVSAVGMRVSACAIGQASAALLAKHCAGRPAKAIESTANEVAAWIAGDGPRPAWPGFSVLEPARDFEGRHGALLLPWNAAVTALSLSPDAG